MKRAVIVGWATRGKRYDDFDRMVGIVLRMRLLRQEDAGAQQ
jgi:hypothetical protein